MVHQDQGGVVTAPSRAPQWPPKGGFSLGQTHKQSFMARCAKAGGRPVEWPPRGDDRYSSQPVLNSSPNLLPTYSAPGDQVAPPPVPPRPTQYPLRKVVTSQPAFKTTKPIKMRGDNKWPPANAQEGDSSQQEVREFIKPTKKTKDYSGFFAKHALPSNYTGYRAPPGTQHVGSAEFDDGTTDM